MRVVNPLLNRAREGDMEAFAELFEPLRGTIHAVALRVAGTDDAEDVVMDTFLKAWQGLPGYDGRASLTTWLCRIARNRALDLRRRAAVRRAESLDAAPAPEHDARLVDVRAPTPAELADRAELSTDIEAAMARLPEAHRQVLLLRHVDGLRYAEIAAALGLSIGTVMSRLFYGRARLRRLLGAWDPRAGTEGGPA